MQVWLTKITGRNAAQTLFDPFDVSLISGGSQSISLSQAVGFSKCIVVADNTNCLVFATWWSQSTWLAIIWLATLCDLSAWLLCFVDVVCCYLFVVCSSAQCMLQRPLSCGGVLAWQWWRCVRADTEDGRLRRGDAAQLGLWARSVSVSCFDLLHTQCPSRCFQFMWNHKGCLFLCASGLCPLLLWIHYLAVVWVVVLFNPQSVPEKVLWLKTTCLSCLMLMNGLCCIVLRFIFCLGYDDIVHLLKLRSRPKEETTAEEFSYNSSAACKCPSLWEKHHLLCRSMCKQQLLCIPIQKNGFFGWAQNAWTCSAFFRGGIICTSLLSCTSYHSLVWLNANLTRFLFLLFLCRLLFLL